MSQVHYIVIEVREAGHEGAAGFLRSRIHGLAQDHGLDIADVLVRGDRERSYIGTPEPWQAVRDAFRSVMPRRETLGGGEPS